MRVSTRSGLRNSSARSTPRAVASSSSPRLDAELLAPVLGGQGLGELVELALHHLGDAVAGEPDAVVAHAVLREVVGADLLGAVAAADHGAARCAALLVLLRLLELEEARPQDCLLYTSD